MLRRALPVAVALDASGGEVLPVVVDAFDECEPCGHVHASVGEPPDRRCWR
jgi:hypothetical protein